MHEQSLIKNLVEKIQQLAADEDAKVIGAKLRLGALAHISADHLREHFEQAIHGTPLEGLRLDIEVRTDIHHIEAQEIILENLQFEARDGY
ncbi:hydrogenase/urease maturation nickel metallochaperone HypA [Microbulbifer echini]|uniref:Hydrogenase/urease maturation nickel metallochaperone HypA n=1 Tax=Microbulbifer echini TaxID=1529067 RepID=A0ABV4NS02_9GAMM|nr:hydrogenase/urease maturation nickel metallochaperone HypA [uncultured Microbulbifer sp.]